MFDRKQYEREMRRVNKRQPKNHREANADCGKVPYSTREEALGVAATRLRPNCSNRKYLRVYQCPTCSEFHLTHKEKRF